MRLIITLVLLTTRVAAAQTVFVLQGEDGAPGGAGVSAAQAAKIETAIAPLSCSASSAVFDAFSDGTLGCGFAPSPSLSSLTVTPNRGLAVSGTTTKTVSTARRLDAPLQIIHTSTQASPHLAVGATAVTPADSWTFFGDTRAPQSGWAFDACADPTGVVCARVLTVYDFATGPAGFTGEQMAFRVLNPTGDLRLGSPSVPGVVYSNAAIFSAPISLVGTPATGDYLVANNGGGGDALQARGASDFTNYLAGTKAPREVYVNANGTPGLYSGLNHVSVPFYIRTLTLNMTGAGSGNPAVACEPGDVVVSVNCTSSGASPGVVRGIQVGTSSGTCNFSLGLSSGDTHTVNVVCLRTY